MEATKQTDWVLDIESPDMKTKIEHLSGVSWSKAPLPRRVHRCTPQTRGWIDYFTEVQRCPCGAIRGAGDPRWQEKNSRRRYER